MPLSIMVAHDADPSAFVQFWAPKYHDPHEELYINNIGAPRTRPSLQALFQWKIGNRLFKHSLPSIEKNFISRLEELDLLPQNTRAESFLAQFATGGAIWRIFWLHCWDQKYPIYDQHVHRAMAVAQTGAVEEIEAYSDDKKIEMYLNRYLAFIEQFSTCGRRETDRSLWAAGKFYKGWLKSGKNESDET